MTDVMGFFPLSNSNNVISRLTVHINTFASLSTKRIRTDRIISLQIFFSLKQLGIFVTDVTLSRLLKSNLWLPTFRKYFKLTLFFKLMLMTFKFE